LRNSVWSLTWIQLAQDTGHWQDFADKVMNLRGRNWTYLPGAL
jgi:hypothetical protein